MSPILRVGQHVPLVASLAHSLSLAPLAPLLPAALGQTEGEGRKEGRKDGEGNPTDNFVSRR